MSILAGIVGLVGLLCLLVVVVGLISPTFFKDKKTGEVPKRSHLAVGGVAGHSLPLRLQALSRQIQLPPNR